MQIRLRLVRAIRGIFQRLCGHDINRDMLAARFLRGSGIEIGARNIPLALPKSAKATYVDCMETEMLQAYSQGPEETVCMPVDVVDDAQYLRHFATESQDFIVANHVLEHLEDPLGALTRFFEVLRPRGVLYLALPEKRLTFDRARDTTTLEHLQQDQIDGGTASHYGHHVEAIQLTPGLPPDQWSSMISKTLADKGSIHYHCWTQWEMLEMLLYLRKNGGCFDLQHFSMCNKECLIILRKSTSQDMPAQAQQHNDDPINL